MKLLSLAFSVSTILLAAFFAHCLQSESKKGNTMKKELIKFVKALAHGILVPSMLALAVFYFQTEKDLLKAEYFGAVYLMIPVFIYSETKIMEERAYQVSTLF